jgi:hypothetical protein
MLDAGVAARFNGPVTRPSRLLIVATLLGSGALLQACLVGAVVGTAVGVGGAAVGAVVKGTEAVGKAVIPLAEPRTKGQP